MNKKENNKETEAVIDKADTNESLVINCWNFGLKRGNYSCVSATTKDNPTFVASTK